MTKTAIKFLIVGAAAFAATTAYAAADPAQQQGASTPKDWSYQLDSHGNRVAKGNRVANPDGSWREEVRQGNCVTVKEKSATGEYKETRQCNPS